MTDNVITAGTATNGDLYLYSIGLTDHHLPELILIVDGNPGPDATNGIASLMASLMQRQIAAANSGVINNDETVDLPDLGVRARLHTVEPHSSYPMPKFVSRYGFACPMVTEVTIEARDDA